LSNLFICVIGNDTIHRYPLSYEGRLTKILCITKEAFKNLKAVSAEFEFKPRSAQLKPKTSFQQKRSKKEPLAGPRNGDLKTDEDKYTGSFEPSNIFCTRESSFWRLRNFKTWFKEQGSYEDLRYIKSYSIKI
jgi:hypothetical protein